MRFLMVLVIFNHFPKFIANFKIKILRSKYFCNENFESNIFMYFYMVNILVLIILKNT